MKQGNSYHRKTIIEEHYVLVGEPYEFYITHVTPTNGTGKLIAQAIVMNIIHYKQNIVLNKLRTQELLNKHER